MILKSKRAVIASLAITILCLSPNIPVKAEQISSEVQAALDYYLNLNCTVGETSHALQDLVAHRVVLEPLFTDLALHGLTENQAIRNKLDHALNEDWLRRERHLQLSAIPGLKERDLQILRKVTKQEFTDRAKAQIIREYRERAVYALGAFHTTKASNALDALKRFDPSFGPVIDAARKREQANNKRRGL